MVPSSRHAARSREARPRPAGGAPGLYSGAGRLISVVGPSGGSACMEGDSHERRGRRIGLEEP